MLTCRHKAFTLIKGEPHLNILHTPEYFVHLIFSVLHIYIAKSHRRIGQNVQRVMIKISSAFI